MKSLTKASIESDVRFSYRLYDYHILGVSTHGDLVAHLLVYILLLMIKGTLRPILFPSQNVNHASLNLVIVANEGIGCRTYYRHLTGLIEQ